MLVYLDSPRRRREKIVCTTFLQGHRSQESGLCSLVRGECTTAVQAGGEPRDNARSKKEEDGKEGKPEAVKH